jgi:predicted ATPase
MELLHASGRAREAEEQSRSSQRLLLARPLAPEARSGERESSVSLPRESQLDLSRRERTPLLVGRTREFAQLSACLTRPGALRACLVEAEAGVGKTHLVQRAIAQLHVGSVLQGAALELTPRSPYAPWLSLLRAALGVHADLELSSLLAALTESAGEDSASLRERLFRGVSAFLERVCKQSGRLALVLDDTHWLDEGSAELLLHVSESCAALPISLLLTARPGVLGDNLPLLRVLRALRRSGVLEELQLLPFCEAETAELLRSLASPADPAEVQRDSAGNALFALELARARDAARREQDVPPSIARLVRDRIAALPAEVADVLRWASVLGGSFESERLTPLLALDEEAFVAALEQLQRHDFLGFRGSECVFSHAIVRAAVYDALSSPRRQLMHLKVARLLLEQADPSGLLAGELSRHALLGGDAALAVRACMAAGKRCLRLSAVADAYALSQRGLACVASLSEPERTTLEIELLHLSILARRGDPSGALSERLAELSERALELGAIGHASTATYLRAVLRWEAGHPADAQRFTREMERISRQGDLRQRMLSLGDAARCLAHLERDLPDAEAFALEAEQLAARSGAPVSSVLLARGTLQRYRGELDSAAHSLSQARELAQREGDRLNEMHVIEELLEVHWARADYAASERDSRELLALGERSRPGSEVAFARASIEIAQLACGADGAGLDAALAALEREDAKQRSACLLVRAAELSLTGQQHERADLFAARALALAALLERRSDAALAWSVRAEVAHARAEPRGLEVALLALVACLATPLSARAQASAAGVVARLNPPSQEKSHGTRNRRARIR